MSSHQKDKAIKEILDESMRERGEKEYRKGRQTKEDKEVADAMGGIDGGGKSSEVDSSVTVTPSKDINKG